MHHYRAPADGRTVPIERLRASVQTIFEGAAVPTDHAATIAELLVDTDLRGISSHGVAQVQRYVEAFTDGTNNAKPDIRVLKESSTTAMLTGDGGLGIVVAKQAMEMAMAKAAEHGVAVVTTVYHDHIGSAGKYVRMALARNMVAMCLSGRSSRPDGYSSDDNPLGSIQGSPPMAFGAPAADGDPDFHLDFATGAAFEEEDFSRRPELFFRSLGIAQMANLLSGTLGGQQLPEFDRRTTEWAPNAQSAFFLVIDLGRFSGVESFTSDVSSLVQGVSGMAPFPGYDEAALPGGVEAAKEKQYRAEGRVPISAEAVASVEAAAENVGVTDLPWDTPRL